MEIYFYLLLQYIYIYIYAYKIKWTKVKPFGLNVKFS